MFKSLPWTSFDFDFPRGIRFDRSVAWSKEIITNKGRVKPGTCERNHLLLAKNEICGRKVTEPEVKHWNGRHDAQRGRDLPLRSTLFPHWGPISSSVGQRSFHQIDEITTAHCLAAFSSASVLMRAPFRISFLSNPAACHDQNYNGTLISTPQNSPTHLDLHFESLSHWSEMLTGLCSHLTMFKR